MLPRSFTRLLLATAAGLIGLQACIVLGGTAGKAAVAFCAVALLIGAPIAILAWLGSMSDLDERQRKQRRQLAMQEHEARLWQQALLELQSSALAESLMPLPAEQPRSALARARARVAWPAAPLSSLARRVRRPILGLLLTIGSTLGLMGCETVFPEWGYVPDWGAVQPGMGKRDLVALVGAPQQIQSNGSTELWQYCRDNFRGRNARYYMTVLIDQEQVRDVRPYPVWSHAGCEDFYRAGS